MNVKDHIKTGIGFVKVHFLHLLVLLLLLALVGGSLVAAANLYVVSDSREYIIGLSDAEGIDADCILVLGCLVKADGSPSDMLSDRLEIGVELYENGAAPKLLMSGDHGRVEYNEVGRYEKICVG